MKNNISAATMVLALLLLAIAGCPNSGTDSKGTAVNVDSTAQAGKPAPQASLESGWSGDAIDFAYTGYDGSKGMASDFAGKPLVVNFWATW